MRRFLFAVTGLWLAAAAEAEAQGREAVGTGRLFTNDFLGDNRDRWRTGTNVISHVRGTGWEGALPERVGDLVEYRFRTEIIAPENIVTAAPGDRRYVGALSFGMHTHFERKGVEFSLGGDMVVTGPQTGLGDLQTWVHEIFGAPEPGVLGNQIPNGFHPTLTVEAGRRLDVSPNLSFRPFVEVQAGVETLVRVGGDFHVGALGREDLLLRDVVTGQLYRVTRGPGQGFSAVLGADVAHVENSTYLPEPAYDLTDARTRLRAGVHWQGERTAVFYGLTYLGEEFEAQTEGQFVGSLRIDFRF